MDDASIAARERARLLESFASGSVWISAPALLTFWVPCLSRVVVHGGSLEIRSPFQREQVPLEDIARVRWFDEQCIGEWHLAVIELRRSPPIKLLPRSRAMIRAFASHVGEIQGGIDVADPKYASIFSVGSSNP